MSAHDVPLRRPARKCLRILNRARVISLGRIIIPVRLQGQSFCLDKDRILLPGWKIGTGNDINYEHHSDE